MVRVAASAVLSFTTFALAQDTPAAPAAPEAAAATPAPEMPEMTPDQMEMMEAWQDYMTPGPEHAELAEMVGTWSAEITDYTMGEQTYTGEATFEMILGGRYLQQTMKSEMMGMPWIGLGAVGFDNAAGEYVSIWMDSMGTGISMMRGKMIDDDTVEMKGEMIDPVTKGPVGMRIIQKDIDDNTVTFEMYMTPPGVPEMKALEIVYKRKA
jgi:hypothetical protein